MSDCLVCIILVFVIWGAVSVLCELVGIDPIKAYMFIIAFELFVHEAKETRKKQKGGGNESD